MPPARLALTLAAVLALGAATALLLTALPADLPTWLMPILTAAALAWRTMGKPR